MKKEKTIRNRIWNWLNKKMEVKYMALYFFIVIILLEGAIIFYLRYPRRYLYGDENQYSDISNKCFETNDGKFCMIPKKVMWYERTDR